MRERFGKWALAAAGVLVGALLLSPVAAHVNNNFAHLWGDHIKPKADGRYVLRSGAPWARVADNGNLVEGLGIDESDRDDVGAYLVKFNRNVSDCAATATAWADDLIATIGTDANPKTLEVNLMNTVNNPVDGPFSIIVRC